MHNTKNIGIIIYISLLILSITACGQQVIPTPEIVDENNASKEAIQILSQDLVSSIIVSETEGSFDKEVSFEKNIEMADVFYTTDTSIYDVENFEKYTKSFFVKENTTIRYFSSYDGVKENIQAHTIVFDEEGLLDFIEEQDSIIERDDVFFGEVYTFLNSFDIQPSVVQEIQQKSILRKFEEDSLEKINENVININESDIDEKELIDEEPAIQEIGIKEEVVKTAKEDENVEEAEILLEIEE